jgi:hypothetical protein
MQRRRSRGGPALRSRAWSRLGVLGISALMLLAAPTAAWADPAGPTHYRSTIDAIRAEDGSAVDVDVEVLGGDAFLVLRAADGSEVQVPGYEGEPYLRLDADGTVHVNTRSPALYLNEARYGEADPRVDLPQGADADAPPTWELVARGGTYAWHDHRIHFMSASLPPGIDPSLGVEQEVWTWEVPLRVDGQEVTVTGTLTWVPGPPPAVPLVATVVAIALVVVALLRWPSALPGTVVVVGLASGVVGIVKSVGLPPGADAEPALLVLPAMALGTAGVAAALRRGHHAAAAWLEPAAGVPIGVWGVLQVGALLRPIVPGPVPLGIVRVVTVAALAVGIAAVVVGVRRVLDATRLDVDTAASGSAGLADDRA